MDLHDEVLSAYDDIVAAILAATGDPGAVAHLASLLMTFRMAEHDALYPTMRDRLADGDRAVDRLVGRQERLAAFASELPHADATDRVQLARRLLDVLAEHRDLLVTVVLPELLQASTPQEQRDVVRRFRGSQAQPASADPEPSR